MTGWYVLKQSGLINNKSLLIVMELVDGPYKSYKKAQSTIDNFWGKVGNGRYMVIEYIK